MTSRPRKTLAFSGRLDPVSTPRRTSSRAKHTGKPDLPASGVPSPSGSAQSSDSPMSNKSAKKKWSPEEEEELRQLVQQYGDSGNWIHIARALGDRTAKQCRERWKNIVQPDLVKRPWTREEDEYIFSEVNRIGTRWTVIAKALGRGDNQVKNRYYSDKRRRERLAGGTCGDSGDSESEYADGSDRDPEYRPTGPLTDRQVSLARTRSLAVAGASAFSGPSVPQTRTLSSPSVLFPASGDRSGTATEAMARLAHCSNLELLKGDFVMPTPPRKPGGRKRKNSGATDVIDYVNGQPVSAAAMASAAKYSSMQAARTSLERAMDSTGAQEPIRGPVHISPPQARTLWPSELSDPPEQPRMRPPVHPKGKSAQPTSLPPVPQGSQPADGQVAKETQFTGRPTVVTAQSVLLLSSAVRSGAISAPTFPPPSQQYIQASVAPDSPGQAAQVFTSAGLYSHFNSPLSAGTSPGPQSQAPMLFTGLDFNGHAFDTPTGNRSRSPAIPYQGVPITHEMDALEFNPDAMMPYFLDEISGNRMGFPSVVGCPISPGPLGQFSGFPSPSMIMGSPQSSVGGHQPTSQGPTSLASKEPLPSHAELVDPLEALFPIPSSPSIPVPSSDLVPDAHSALVPAAVQSVVSPSPPSHPPSSSSAPPPAPAPMSSMQARIEEYKRVGLLKHYDCQPMPIPFIDEPPSMGAYAIPRLLTMGLIPPYPDVPWARNHVERPRTALDDFIERLMTGPGNRNRPVSPDPDPETVAKIMAMPAMPHLFPAPPPKPVFPTPEDVWRNVAGSGSRLSKRGVVKPTAQSHAATVVAPSPQPAVGVTSEPLASQPPSTLPFVAPGASDDVTQAAVYTVSADPSLASAFVQAALDASQEVPSPPSHTSQTLPPPPPPPMPQEPPPAALPRSKAAFLSLAVCSDVCTAAIVPDAAVLKQAARKLAPATPGTPQSPAFSEPSNYFTNMHQQLLASPPALPRFHASGAMELQSPSTTPQPFPSPQASSYVHVSKAQEAALYTISPSAHRSASPAHGQHRDLIRHNSLGSLGSLDGITIPDSPRRSDSFRDCTTPNGGSY